MGGIKITHTSWLNLTGRKKRKKMIRPNVFSTFTPVIIDGIKWSDGDSGGCDSSQKKK